LWFIRKGEKRPAGRDGNIQDYIESEKPPKEYHEWAQSTKEVIHVAEKLTVEGDVILRGKQLQQRIFKTFTEPEVQMRS